MRHIAISCIVRPHITDGPACWCRAAIIDDMCCHKWVEPRPDNQERMACFSEQRTIAWR